MTCQQHSNSTGDETLIKDGNSRRLSCCGLLAAILVISAFGSADCKASINVEEEHIRVQELTSNTELPLYGDPVIWKIEKELGIDIDGDGHVGQPPSVLS